MTASIAKHPTSSASPAALPKRRAALRVVSSKPRTVLKSVQDVRSYFATRQRRTFFVSPSNFNMMDMHRAVCGWHNITLLDCYDGSHPQCLVVPDDHSRIFSGVEDVNHYLLDQPKVQALLQARPGAAEKDQVLFLFFDEDLERQCAELGLEVALPPNRLVREVDSKIVTTRLGDAAGVPSVPHVLARVDSYATLLQLAQDHGLGTDLVVQSAYGDSGKTTYFIRTEADYQAVAAQIDSEAEVKVMRRLRCAGMAIEACATRWGTFVGPLLTELIGQPTLTPYTGGWCGNENYAPAFTAAQRLDACRKAQAMGDALYARGYRGSFELDFLLDLDTGAMYLGELNARITGVTALTNTSDFSEAMLPLFWLHLLEFDPQVDLQLDVEEFNQGVLALGAAGASSQLILKYTGHDLQVITQAPTTGVYRMDAEGNLVLVRAGLCRRDALAVDEAFVLRIQKEGEYAYCGGDMAIAFFNHAVREAHGQLDARGQDCVRALQALFSARPLTQEERAAVELAHNPANVKSARE